MAYFRFSPGALVEIRGAEYRPLYANGRLQLTHTITGEVFRYEQPDGTFELPTTAQFSMMRACGDAVTKTPRSSDPIRNRNALAEWTRDQAIASVPRTNDFDRLERMSMACHLLDERGVPNGRKAIKTELDEIWTAQMTAKYGPKPSADSVKKWRQTRGRPGDRHPRHMVPMTGRKIDVPELIPEDQRLLNYCVLDGRKAGRKPKDIYADYAYQLSLLNEGRHPTWAKPDQTYKLYSKRTVERRFNTFESNKTIATQIEAEAIKQDWSGAGKPLAADFVMQFVIVDHTWLDIIVVCPTLQMILGRPWLTLAVDVKSRAIVGWLISFNDPSSWSVAEILRRIVLPKRPPPEMASRYPVLAMMCGKPDGLILDNAVEFRSHNLEAAARDAGFSVRFCPIKQPTYRAIGERAIKTINEQTTRLLPGHTLTLNDARRWGYDAESEAIVMLDELEAVLNIIVALYNTEPHEGIGNQQPALVFERHINRFGINDFADFDSFARDILEVRTDVQLSPTGIRAFGLRFGGKESVPELLNDLAPIEPRRKRRGDATATVEFRYDSMDISRIHVWNRKTLKYCTLYCSDEAYAEGMPLWLHEHIQQEDEKLGLAFNTEEERLIARGALIEAIKNIDPGAHAASRKRLAELLEIPRLKQIAGNLLDLSTASPSATHVGDFIANDRAKPTALDQEILSPRPAPRMKRAKTALERRAEQASLAQRELDTPIHERRLPGRGGF